MSSIVTRLAASCDEFSWTVKITMSTCNSYYIIILVHTYIVTLACTNVVWNLWRATPQWFATAVGWTNKHLFSNTRIVCVLILYRSSWNRRHWGDCGSATSRWPALIVAYSYLLLSISWSRSIRRDWIKRYRLVYEPTIEFFGLFRELGRERWEDRSMNSWSSAIAQSVDRPTCWIWTLKM